MADKPGAFWSAVVWMLNGALCATWLLGAGLAFRQEGIGKGLTALVLPPYAWYVAWQSWPQPGAGARAERWIDPRLESTVDALSSACVTNDAERRSLQLSPRQYEEFCLCMARAIVDLRTPAERDYQQRTGAFSAAFGRRVAAARQSCAGTARFVPPAGSGDEGPPSS